MPELTLSHGIYLILGLVSLIFFYKSWQRRKSYRFGFSLFAGFICVALGIGVGYFDYSNQRTEAQITQAIQGYISEGGLSFQCVNEINDFFKAPSGDTEVVWNEGRNILAKSTSCSQIKKYLKSDSKGQVPDKQITAVHLLNRAVMSATMTTDPAQAECFAMQYDDALAIALGATVPEAVHLRLKYYTDYYPNVRAKYESGECRVGGAFAINGLERPFFAKIERK